MAWTGRRRRRGESGRAVIGSLAMILVLAACNADQVQDEGEPEGVPDPVETPDDEGEAEDGQAFEIAFGSAVSASTFVATQELESFFIPEVEQAVADRTPHTLEITPVMGTLLDIGEETEGIERRQVDMGTSVFPYEPSDLPLHNLAYYVPFSSPDMEVTVAAFRRVYEENDDFAAVYEERNQMPLAFSGIGDYGLLTTFAWDDVEELEGRQIAGVGANLEWLDPVGVSPVQAPAGEWYTSLQTGVYDGVVNFIDGITSLNLYEVADHFMDLQFGSMPTIALNVNLDAWEELPTEVQDVIREVAEEWEQRAAQRINEEVAEAYESMEAEGMTVTTPDVDLRVQWAESLSALPQSRADEAQAAGLPGPAVIEAYMVAQEDLGHDFPVRYEVDGAG